MKPLPGLCLRATALRVIAVGCVAVGLLTLATSSQSATWKKVGSSGLASTTDPRPFMSIWADDDGRIWGGLVDGYLFTYNTVTGQWQDIAKPTWWNSYKATNWPSTSTRGASSICDVAFNTANRSLYMTASTGYKWNPGFTGVWRYDTVSGQFVGKSSGDPDYPFLYKNGGSLTDWPIGSQGGDPMNYQYQALTVGPYGSVMFNGGPFSPAAGFGGGGTDLWTAETAFWMHGEDNDRTEVLQSEGSGEYFAGAGPGCMFARPIPYDTCGCLAYLSGESTGQWRTGELNWVKARDGGGRLGLTTKSFLGPYEYSGWISEDPNGYGGYNNMSYASCYDPLMGQRMFGGATTGTYSPLISVADDDPGSSISHARIGPSFAWPNTATSKFAEVGGMASDDASDLWYGMGAHDGYDQILWDKVYRVRTNPPSNPGFTYINGIDEGNIDPGKVIAVRDMVTVGGKQYALTISNNGQISLYTNGTGRYTPPVKDLGALPTAGEVTATAVGSDGLIYGGTDQGYVFSVNPSTGLSTSLGKPGGSRINNAIAAAGALYFGDNAGNLWKYTPGSGFTLAWDDSLNRGVDGQMASDGAGKIYFVATGPTLYSFDTATNTTTSLGLIPSGRSQGRGMAITGGKLYIATESYPSAIAVSAYTLPSGPFQSLTLPVSLASEGKAYSMVVNGSVVYGGTGVAGHLFSINGTTVADLGLGTPDKLNPPSTPMYQSVRSARPLAVTPSGQLWYATSPIWNQQAKILALTPGSPLSPTNPVDVGQLRIDSNYVSAGVVSGGRLYFGTKWREGNSHILSRSLTPEDLNAPHPPSGFVATSADGGITMNWQNPGSPDVTQTMVRYSTTGFPATATDGTQLVLKSAAPYANDSTTHTGITNGVLTYYSAFSGDAAGNWSVAATTSGLARVNAVTSFAAAPGFQTNTLTWKNSASTASAGTIIVFRTDRSPTAVNDGTLVVNQSGAPNANGSYIHTNLSNGIPYYYAAFAYDNQPSYSAAALAQATPVTPSPPNLLQNSDMETMPGTVASNWTSYNNASMVVSGYLSQIFETDLGVKHKGTRSQKIRGIDTSRIPNNGTDYYVQAGLYQVVPANSGKLYLMVGWQNLNSTSFTGTGYYHQFGISPTGSSNPGTPGYGVNVTDAVWLRPGESLFNNDGGGASYIPGWKKLFSATPAVGSSISCWTGVGIRAKGNRTIAANQMNLDDNYLYELDAPVGSSLLNANMESDIITLSEAGLSLPAGWQPVGGSIGSNCGYEMSIVPALTSPHGARSAVVRNSQGKINAGLLQRVATIAGQQLTFSAYARAGATSNDAGTRAYVGIDPNGGTSILSSSIVWSVAANVGGTAGWTQMSVSKVATGPSATVFMRVLSDGGAGENTAAEHTVLFDDAALTATPGITSSPVFQTMSNGASVGLRNQVITAAWPGFFYIEDTDRTWGIKVVSSTAVGVGNAVDIIGTIQTVGGERQITATGVQVASAVNALPLPLGLNSNALGGANLGNNPGVVDATGLYNVGLRIKITGRVSNANGSTFDLSDGGVTYKVFAQSLSLPAIDTMVSVVGISSVDQSTGSSRRFVRATAINAAP